MLYELCIAPPLRTTHSSLRIIISNHEPSNHEPSLISFHTKHASSGLRLSVIKLTALYNLCAAPPLRISHSSLRIIIPNHEPSNHEPSLISFHTKHDSSGLRLGVIKLTALYNLCAAPPLRTTHSSFRIIISNHEPSNHEPSMISFHTKHTSSGLRFSVIKNSRRYIICAPLLHYSLLTTHYALRTTHFPRTFEP